MLKLIKGLPGVSFDRFVCDFTQAYSKDSLETCAILPTQTLARRLRRDLARRGIPIASTSITTLEEFAHDQFESSNGNHVILSRFETEMILRSIIIANKNQLSLFFKDKTLRQGFVPEVRALLSTLLDFNIDYPRCLGDLKSRKSEQLALILDRYFTYLGENNLLDPHEILNWASELYASGKGIRLSNLLFYGLFEPIPAEGKFILALADSCPNAHYYLISSDNKKVFLDDGEWLSPDAIEEISESDESVKIANLFQLKEKEDEKGRIHLSAFEDPLTEMRIVAAQVARLIDEGEDPSSIAILLPMREKTAPLLRQVLEDFSIPANLRVGVGFSESPIIQTIFDVLETVHHDFRREDVVRLLSSPYTRFKFDYEGKEESLFSFDVDRYAREAGMIVGKNAWLQTLDNLVTLKKEEFQSPDITEAANKAISFQLERIVRTRAGMEALISDLGILEGERSLLEHLSFLRKVLKRLEISKHLFFKDKKLMARETKALRLFIGLIAEMERSQAIFGEERITPDEFIQYLRTEAISHTFIPEKEKKNAVMVAGLRSAVLQPFEHVFIVGMVDGEMPRLDIRYPFASEEEVVKMGLLSPKDILRQERYYFIAALLSAGKTVHISYPLSEGGDKLLPSPFVEELREAFDLSPFEEVPLTRSRLKSQEMTGAAIAGEETEDLGDLEPDLNLNLVCDRINIEEFRRAGPYHSVYDGIMTDDIEITNRMRDQHSRRTYSASMLETYIQCPFKFYMRYILGFEPIPEVEDEIQPVEAGLLFHRIAYRFYSERRDAGLGKISSSDTQAALSRIRAIGLEEMERSARAGAAWEAFKLRMLGEGSKAPGTLGIFIDNELLNPMPLLDPKMFELSIGVKREKGEMDPSSVTKPVSIEFGVGEPSAIALRCMIDRVDMDDAGHFFVIDYKTSIDIPTPKSVAEGIHIQIPLYLMAIERAFPGKKGIGGGYYRVRGGNDTQIVPVLGDAASRNLLGEFGKKRCVNDDFALILASTSKRTQELVQGMMSARFHPSSLGEECGMYCDYFSVCRFSEIRLLEMGVK